MNWVQNNTKYNVRGELVIQRVSRKSAPRPRPRLHSSRHDTLRSSHHTTTLTLLHYCFCIAALLHCKKKNEFNSIQVIAQGIYIAVYTPVYCIPLALHADQENHCRKRKGFRTNGKILNQKNMALWKASDQLKHWSIEKRITRDDVGSSWYWLAMEPEWVIGWSSPVVDRTRSTPNSVFEQTFFTGSWERDCMPRLLLTWELWWGHRGCVP